MQKHQTVNTNRSGDNVSVLYSCQVCFFEMSITIYQTTQNHILEDRNPQLHSCGNLKPLVFQDFIPFEATGGGWASCATLSLLKAARWLHKKNYPILSAIELWQEKLFDQPCLYGILEYLVIYETENIGYEIGVEVKFLWRSWYGLDRGVGVEGWEHDVGAEPTSPTRVYNT